MIKKLCLIGGLFSVAVCVNAQVEKNSRELIDEGKEELKEQNYDKALQLFRKVSKSDTNYITALYQSATTLYSKKDYESCIETCDKGLLYALSYLKKSFLEQKARALDNLDKFEEAVAIYDQLILDNPYNYLSYNSKAKILLKVKKYQDAINALEKSLELNPYNPDTHIQLGLLAKQEGKKTLASIYLSNGILLNTQLFSKVLEMNGYTKYSATSPSIQAESLDALSNNLIGDDETENNGLTFGGEGDDFASLDGKLASGAGSSSNYKLKSSFAKIKMIRQLHYMMSNLKKSGNGLVSKKFVAFYQNIMTTNKFDEFAALLLLNSPSNEVKKKASSKKKTFDKSFFPFMHDYWSTVAAKTTVLNEQGKKVDGYGIFFGTPDLLAVYFLQGFSENYNKFNYSGYVQEYNTYESFKKIGKYNESGKKEGLWVYYDEYGKKYAQQNFKSGELNGLTKLYNDSGVLSKELNYSNGKLTGEVIGYFDNGIMSFQRHFNSKEELNGEYREYYGTGAVKQEGNYVSGKFDGIQKSYWPNGKLSNTATYKDGELDGLFQNYSETGKLLYSVEFKEGKKNGKMVNYYSTGGKQSEGTYVNDNPSGVLQEYYAEGGVSQITNFDASGKKNGKVELFAENGRKYFEILFEKGIIKSYVYYDSANNPKYNGKATGNKIDYKLYYSDGVLQMEGKFDGENKVGVWKSYNNYGILESEENYTAGKKSGVEKEYFTNNGKLKTESKFEKDVRVGTTTYYHNDGLVKAKGAYSENSKTGIWKYYYPNSNLGSEEFTGNPEGHYTVEYFYSITGKKVLENVYDQNLKLLRTYNFDTTGKIFDTVEVVNFGVLKTYYPRRIVQSECQYLNQMKHGTYKKLYTSGKLETAGNYTLNEAHGSWKWYYENGTLFSEGNYYYGEKDGLWKWYHDNGKVQIEKFYNKGTAIGLEKEYFDNGNLKETTESDSFGKMHGQRIQYDMSGNIQLIRYYYRDKLISYSYLGADNKPVAPIYLNNGTGAVVAKYPNGKISREFTYKNGSITGSYKVYHKNGNLMDSFYNKQNISEGIRTVFYENGKIKEMSNYKSDLRNGLYQEYYSNGNLKHEGTFIYGNKEGWWSEYDNAGKLIKKRYYFNDNILY